MDSKCFLTSTDLQTSRARCQHQLSFLFYRVTLCVSAVFAITRRPSVHPSVCLSHWWIVSTRLKISSNFFLAPVAPSEVSHASTPRDGAPALSNFRGTFLFMRTVHPFIFHRTTNFVCDDTYGLWGGACF